MSCWAVIGDRPIYSSKQRESIERTGGVRRYSSSDSRLGCPASAKRKRSLATLIYEDFR